MSSVEPATGRQAGERPGDRSPPPVRSGRAPVSRKHVEIVLLLAPALLLYLAFVLFPVVQSAKYSFFKWNGLEPLTNVVGLDNYTRALQDPIFTEAVKHNAIFITLSLVVQLPLGLGLALILNRKMVGRSALRMVVFAPYVLSEVTTAVAWQLMLAPDAFVDTLMRNLGLGGLVQDWLGSLDLVIYTLFVVITWKYIGFAVILFIAGLQGIPRELTDAARIDGANGWQLARRITLPLLGPTIRIWIFLSIIGSLQLFDIVYIMTNGGPGNASNTMVTYLYNRGFVRNQFGYGSAASVILFIISFAFALLYQRYVLRRDIEGALTRRVG
jgi:raffinose/stachyose/melibiose transport system permease protein